MLDSQGIIVFDIPTDKIGFKLAAPPKVHHEQGEGEPSDVGADES
jgi:hypothetical protein